MTNLMKTLVLGLALVVAAVSPGWAGDVNTLNVGFYIEPTTLDPHIVTSTDAFIAWNIYEPLVGLHRDTFKTEPRLATSWEVSADQTVYTFKLRKGVKFHDGTTMDASAVKASIERTQHFKRGSSWLLQSVKDVKVVDDHTVQVTLAKPDIAFHTGLPFIYIVSPAAIKKHEEQPGDRAPKWFITNSAGTGPYRIESWQRGQKLTLAKFDDYWGGWKKAHVTKVVYWAALEAGTQRLMVEKGDLDIPLIFTADDVEAYKKLNDVTVDVKKGVDMMWIRLQNQAGPTKDKRVRQALSLAFDWKAYETVMRGQVAPSDGAAPAQLLGGWKPEGVLREYNIEKAKKLLAEAGYPKGFRMTYVMNTGDEEKRILGEVWRAGLQKLGVEVEMKVMTWPTLVERLVRWGEKKDPATAETSYAQYSGARIPDAYAYLYYLYHSTASKAAGRNFMYYANAKVDELILRAAASPDGSERIKLYREAAQLVVDDVPDIFVNNIPDISVRRKVVQGWYQNPLHRRAYNFYDLYKSGP